MEMSDCHSVERDRTRYVSWTTGHHVGWMVGTRDPTGVNMRRKL